MAASRRTDRALTAAVAAAAFLLALGAFAPALCDDTPSPQEAIEKARSLEKSGYRAEARLYLEELVAEDGPLAREAEVLLEAARLAETGEESRAYAARVIDRTRNARLLYAAHVLRGDSLFAEGLYLGAAQEFEKAARYSPDGEEGEAELRHARSLLASGDTAAAIEAFRGVAEGGAVPTDVTPHGQLGLARALLTAGHSTEAAELFELIASTYPDHELRPRALAGAAEGHETAGADSAAIAALERLLEEHPESYEATLARDRLRTYEPRAVDEAPGETGEAPGDTTETAAPEQ